ncbi:MAG TPA: 2Fe-2S iron-sulfur cluster-binding protein [Gaiellaceae bacterium]|nr:2Fe-2S iron-sulfur cluster-binding protein [Gaiellaceae bacterium]
MRFSFAGVEYEGREGETLAAALVRNGVLGGFRSPYRDRPRGVFSDGEEEPNALVRVGDEPLARATLVELEEGLVAEPVAGKGRLEPPRRERRYDSMHAHCDVLVVGAGPAGRAAAAAGGGDVILAELGRCAPLDGVRVLERTAVVGLYDGNLAVAVERGRRLWRIRARRIVLATGAVERPTLFEDNDRPGVMLAGAFKRYGRPAGATPVSGGFTPRVQLWRQAGGRLRWDDRVGAPVPDGELRAVACAGSVTGEGLPDAPPFALPDGEEGRIFVDLERDATVADVRRAVAAGLRSVEHVKRYTTIGTGPGQGRTSGVLATRVAAELLGVHPGELGTTTARPPYLPVPFALLAGRNRGPLFDPVRVTPLHERHVELGAVFEDVGQWKRPRYYPRSGEEMDAAVLRECAAVRERVGMQDVSTLGKIDVQGPDAAELLDRLYTNLISTLPVGMCRYGVMCRADGMVFDDGVVMRLGEGRFLCTTTTGNAAAVLAWMEEWLQTEWPELRVWLASVTEQWAAVAVAGPDAREFLQPLTGVALDAASFPFMAIREGEVVGIPARVCRVSFSGELAFEVWVDGRRGHELWRALEGAGGATPYGTEAMHVLRAEKAYPIVGQDTDGTVTPQDLGMDWVVSKKKGHFVGKRSFDRPDTSRADRKQLVAVLPADPDELLPEGAQLVADPDVPPPVPMLGHVTSSYRSAALGRTFALALVRGGRGRVGETVHAPLEDRVVPAVLAEPVLYDPEGRRRDGRPA